MIWLFSFISYRQPTPFDRLCYKVLDPEEGTLGSRVFIDCDVLMKLVFENLVDEDVIKDWESGQEERTRVQDAERDPPQVSPRMLSPPASHRSSPAKVKTTSSHAKSSPSKTKIVPPQIRPLSVKSSPAKQPPS